MERSIFFEEWRRCLGEQYKSVIRHEDKVTERTLVPVLQRLGFTEDDLRALYIEATARAEDLPPDFLPQLPSYEAPTEAAPASQPHPAECTCPSCVTQVNEAAHDAEGQPLPPEVLAEAEAPDDERTLFPVVKPDDGQAKQLSMF